MTVTLPEHAVQAQSDHRRLEINKGKNLLLRQNADAGRRPYIHPLFDVSGACCLTEDSPAHHPWQHGIYTGFHGVAGSDLWFDQGDAVGRIEVQKLSQDSEQAWTVQCIWRHHHGQVLLEETQQWSLAVVDDQVQLDLHWELSAPQAITLDQCDYGGLFIRMPFRHERACHVLNNRGQRDDDCEQQRAAWLAMDLMLPDSDDVVFMALFTKPDADGQDIPWRVDGTRGLNPSPVIAGPLRFDAEQRRQWDYRIITGTGLINQEQIEHAYHAFVGA